MKKLKKKGSYHVVENSLIPASRGLGSSANVIVAGCKTANILYGNNKLTDDEIVKVFEQIGELIAYIGKQLSLFKSGELIKNTKSKYVNPVGIDEYHFKFCAKNFLSPKS